MLTLNGIDFELPTLCREPSCGYTYEYNEYTMISGRVRRVYKGRRFTITFSYGALTSSQLAYLKNALNNMQANGYVYMEADTPLGTFAGNVILTMNGEQTRFRMDYDKTTKTYTPVWINWSFTAKSMDLDTSDLEA